MTLGFEPLLIHIGPLAVRSFGLLALLGLGVAIWLTLSQEGLAREPILRALAWAIPVGVISARVVHVLGWWDFYLMHPADIARLSIDGLSLWGGLVGGGLVAAATLRHDPQRRRRVFDAAAPGIALGIAVGRVGAFLDGYGQGLPSDLPWATHYTSQLMATPDFGVPRHPAQLYDALVAVALCLLTLRLPENWRASVFLALYAAARLALGAVRLDPAFLFGFQIEQLLAAGTLVVGIVYALKSAQRAARQVPRRVPQPSDPVAA